MNQLYKETKKKTTTQSIDIQNRATKQRIQLQDKWTKYACT